LVRRLLEGEVARRGFEYPQRIQRWQAVDHAAMRFSYARGEISSFVVALLRPYLHCMKNRDLKQLPSSEELYALEQAARVASSSARRAGNLRSMARSKLGLASRQRSRPSLKRAAPTNSQLASPSGQFRRRPPPPLARAGSGGEHLNNRGDRPRFISVAFPHE